MSTPPDKPSNLVKERGGDLGKFVAELAEEGERSAVVLGASRADSLLEELLKVTTAVDDPS